MKKFLFLSLLLSGVSQARELRTPLNLMQGQMGHFHIPLTFEAELEDKLVHPGEWQFWDLQPWGGIYAQSASQAYGPCNNEKVPISQLFFGKSGFKGREIFAYGVVTDSGSPSALGLDFVTITPGVEYDESGIVVGFNAIRRFHQNASQAGVRTRLPFRVIEMHRMATGDNTNLTAEDIIAAVRQYQSSLFPANTDPGVTQGTTIEPDWAYRLDFIAAMCYSSCTKQMVQFGTAASPTRIFSKNVTELGSLSPDARVNHIQGNPIHLKQIPIGGTPTGLFGATWDPTVMALPYLDGVGTGPGDFNRTRFKNGTDYSTLAGSPVEQSKFWIVPTLVKNGGQNSLIEADDAEAIRIKIEQIISWMGSNLSPFTFFRAQGISFDTQKTRGIGDLETEFFIGHHWGDRWFWERENKQLYSELQLILHWPTGDRAWCPNLLYTQIARGNDGHFELGLRTFDYWMPVRWFVWRADLAYYKVFQRSEKVAASFVGSTVKNINPTVDANVQWQYVILHNDFNFFHPSNPGLGMVIGYELYWKGKDGIQFLANGSGCDCTENTCGYFVNGQSNGTTAADFFGHRQTLDASVIEKDTERISHKMRAELFHHWNFGDLFLGWSSVVGGKNVMQETAWQLGMTIQF
jgi:hypothetical protein